MYYHFRSNSLICFLAGQSLKFLTQSEIFLRKYFFACPARFKKKFNVKFFNGASLSVFFFFFFLNDCKKS